MSDTRISKRLKQNKKNRFTCIENLREGTKKQCLVRFTETTKHCLIRFVFFETVQRYIMLKVKD